MARFNMRTVDASDAVIYRVLDYDTNKLIVWERIVKFFRHRRQRAGGPAFVEAAREQERVCMELNRKESEKTGVEPE